MAEKKTIFIAHNWSYHSFSAMSYYLALNLSELHRVVFFNVKGPRNGYTKINDSLEVYDWPHKRPTKLKDFLFFFKLLRKYKPDIVLAHFSSVNICVLGARLFNIKNNYCYFHTLVEQNILDLAGKKPSGFGYKVDIFKKGLVYKLAGNIIAVSQYAKKDIIKYFHVNPDKIRVIYNGIADTACRNNYTAIKIGFVGRFDYSKGLDVLINAIGLLLGRGIDVTLEIAGSGKQREALEAHIQSKGWQGAIRFLGPVPYEEIHNFISSNYLLVVPSRIDNLPSVVIEAFSTQTPVVAANVGGIPELIEHNKNGLLFKTEEISDLAEKILLLIINRELRDGIAAAGRKHYEMHHTIERNVQVVKNLLLSEN
jgi:glycosyltransferase involved in cell wall biosynthesis